MGWLDQINEKIRMNKALDQMIQDRPTYESFRGGDGNLLDKYTLQKGGDVAFTSNLDQLMEMLNSIDSLDKLKERAYSTDASPWAQLMLQKAAQDEQSAMDTASAAGNAGTASAYSNLAKRGGLTAGARMALAGKGAKNLMTAKQGVRRDASTNRLNILGQDEAQKLDILKSLPGMEFQKTGIWANMANTEGERKQTLDLANRQYGTGVDQFNIQSLMGDVKNKQDFDMAQYSELMKAWAANKQADAQASAGKK